MLLQSLSALATIPFINTVQLSAPSICIIHYGHMEPLASDWIQIGEESVKGGITRPIYTVSKPA